MVVIVFAGMWLKRMRMSFEGSMHAHTRQRPAYLSIRALVWSWTHASSALRCACSAHESPRRFPSGRREWVCLLRNHAWM